MGDCNSGDHIGEGHIHTDITICNREVPQLVSPITSYFDALTAFICCYIYVSAINIFLMRERVTHFTHFNIKIVFKKEIKSFLDSLQTKKENSE